MLCGKCRKNQATKTYEQIKNGKKETAYYCLECYHKRFVCPEDTAGQALLSCPYCGTSVAQLKRTNIVGCAHCYQTLAHAVLPVVTKMQGCEIHKGKKAYETQAERVERRCFELEALAQQAYEEEDYLAAKEYEERVTRLRRGEEEDFVWRNRPLSKRS